MIGHCGRGQLPAALGLLRRQLDDAGPAEVHLELALLDEDPRPDDFARLRDALERAAAEAEVHRPAAARSMAPLQPPTKWAGGTEPLIRNTQT